MKLVDILLDGDVLIKLSPKELAMLSAGLWCSTKDHREQVYIDDEIAIEESPDDEYKLNEAISKIVFDLRDGEYYDKAN